MPAVSRWMIRCSFVYLLVGFGMGAIMLLNKAYPVLPFVWFLLPLHIETMIFGWIIQFTLGTAYWILPRFLTKPKRGPQWMGYVMIGFLNTGIICILLENLIETNFPASLWGRGFELTAVLLFIALHWHRIVTYRHRKN